MARTDKPHRSRIDYALNRITHCSDYSQCGEHYADVTNSSFFGHWSGYIARPMKHQEFLLARGA